MFAEIFAASCRIDETDSPGVLTKTVSLAEGGRGVLSLAQGEYTQASGRKESPYFSILDRLEAMSSHCP